MNDYETFVKLYRVLRFKPAILTAVFLTFFFSPAIQAARPAFQAPFPCGQVWRASTYEEHNSDAIDLVELNANLTTIGEFQPAIASAPGKVVFDYTWPSGSKKDERWVMVDHKDGWRTHYFHLQEEEGRPRLAVGRKVAMGEVLGRTSNSGASAVHIHYAQMKNVSRDAANLAAQAASGSSGNVLSDGDKKRVRFDDSAIDTYYANTNSWGHFGKEASEKIRSHNCSGGRFVHWFSAGDSYILRYSPGNWNMRINRIHPTGGDNPQMTDLNWGANWNNIISYYSQSGQPHLILYNFATGETHFRRVNPDNSGTSFLKSINKYAGWTHLVPVTLGGEAHVVFYDSRYGYFNVDDIYPTNDGFTSALKTQIKKGYTQIVPYEEGPNRYLLMYKGSNGTMTIQRLKRGSDGKVTREKVWSGKRKAGWTHMVPLIHKGRTYIVGYNSINGTARLWLPKANGSGIETVKKLNWDKGWSALTPYYHDGRGHILRYRISDGKAQKVRLRNNLSGFRLFMNKNWTSGFN